jgi:hypothetical protein
MKPIAIRQAAVNDQGSVWNLHETIVRLGNPAIGVGLDSRACEGFAD